jgi:hypothetical protein
MLFDLEVQRSGFTGLKPGFTRLKAWRIIWIASCGIAAW